MKVFYPVESFSISGRGTVYVGPCPWEDLEDRHNSAIGRTVSMGDNLYEVQGLEYFATVRGPRLGSSIGLLLKEV